MQLFLPFPSIYPSLSVLDKGRCGKQRVESHQIIQIIRGEKKDKKGWRNHPCTRMYSRFLPFLIKYYNVSLAAFEIKGGHNVVLQRISQLPEPVVIPSWFGDEAFHLSHRSNLLRKAIDDSNGIGRNGPKRKSRELLDNLKSVGITEETTPVDLPYIWLN